MAAWAWPRSRRWECLRRVASGHCWLAIWIRQFETGRTLRAHPVQKPVAGCSRLLVRAAMDRRHHDVSRRTGRASSEALIFLCHEEFQAA